jgi:hypothetical protein
LLPAGSPANPPTERRTTSISPRALPAGSRPPRLPPPPSADPSPPGPPPSLMSEGGVVFISGATGDCGALINGTYDRTGESSDGYAVYSKRGDHSMCIEHNAGDWQVKRVSSKGTNATFAYVTGGCALEACTSRVWRVENSNTWNDQPSVKAVTVADAEREVSGRCNPPSPSPPCDTLRFCAGR